MTRKRGAAAKWTIVAQVFACVCVEADARAASACRVPPCMSASSQRYNQTHMSHGITWQHAYFRVALDLGKKPSAVIDPRLVKVATHAARAHRVCACAPSVRRAGKCAVDCGVHADASVWGRKFYHGHALDGTTW